VTSEVASLPMPKLPALPAGVVVPALIADRGEAAAWRYLDFFTAHIRNLNTRAAYGLVVTTVPKVPI